MNFLKIKTSWSGLELWFFKLVVFSCGILMGAYSHEIIFPYRLPLMILTAIGCLFILMLWLKKLSKSDY